MSNGSDQWNESRELVLGSVPSCCRWLARQAAEEIHGPMWDWTIIASPHLARASPLSLIRASSVWRLPEDSSLEVSELGNGITLLTPMRWRAANSEDGALKVTGTQLAERTLVRPLEHGLRGRNRHCCELKQAGGRPPARWPNVWDGGMARPRTCRRNSRSERTRTSPGPSTAPPH